MNLTDDYKNRLKNRLFGLLCEYEKEREWRKYLDAILIELYGFAEENFKSKGLSDKIGMYQAFEKWQDKKPDLSLLPEVDSGKGVSPTSDIVDAFALCEYLRMELKLRAGIVQLHELQKYQIECFNTISKECPQGMLVEPFITM